MIESKQIGIMGGRDIFTRMDTLERRIIELESIYDALKPFAETRGTAPPDSSVSTRPKEAEAAHA